MVQFRSVTKLMKIQQIFETYCTLLTSILAFLDSDSQRETAIAPPLADRQPEEHVGAPFSLLCAKRTNEQ